LAATEDRRNRQAEKAAREKDRREIARFKAAEASTRRICAGLRKIAYAKLEAAGYHRHKGQWRKRLMKKNELSKVTVERIEVLRRASSPDASQADQKACSKMLADSPKSFNWFTDLANVVTYFITQTYSNHAERELALTRQQELKRDFGYEEAKPTERLLIDQVIICYFRMNIAENIYTAKTQESMSISAASFWERKLSATQRRYLRAVETLARVRKLIGSPTLQVNIAAAGGKQVVANRS
jgi:hypothetical protein